MVDSMHFEVDIQGFVLQQTPILLSLWEMGQLYPQKEVIPVGLINTMAAKEKILDVDI